MKTTQILWILLLPALFSTCNKLQGPYDYQEKPPVFNVVYAVNGSTTGNAPIDSKKYMSGATIIVLGNTGVLGKTGYFFNGWNTKSDGSGTNYQAGATIVMGSQNITLYANWSVVPTYTVTYLNTGDSGTVPVDNNSYIQNQTVVILANSGNLVKSGCTFIGWNTLPDGNGINYSPGTTFLMGSANVSLYPTWSINPTYTVSYSGNGSISGTVPGINNYEQGQIVSVLGNTGNLVKTGYAFVGWNTKSDGSGINYLPGSTFTMGTVNVILYAMWTATYTVTYNGNGNTSGSAPVDNKAYFQNQAVTVLGNAGNLVKTGYGLVSWNTKADGSGINYVPGSSFNMGIENVTLYAQWVYNLYSISFDKNDSSASGTMTSQTLASGSSGNLKTNAFVKPGWSFIGWATTPGGNVVYADAANYTMSSVDVTLYAKWSANIYTITFDKNDPLATGSMLPQSIASSSSANLSASGFSKSGWYFTGWATTPGGTPVYLNSASYTMGSSNVVLYARWNISVMVSTYAGSGSAGSADGIGTAASFKWLSDMTTDGTNLYVSDYGNNKIRKIVIATGEVTTFAGSGAVGSADGIGTAASFYGPSSITTDGTNLYVSDYGNYKIRKIVIATREVTTFAGGSSWGYADGIGTTARFGNPCSILKEGDNLYVSDCGLHRIRKIVIATAEVTTLAGNGTGYVDGIGTAAKFYGPFGLTSDGTNLYIADGSNNAIRKMVIATGEVTTFAGSSSAGSADGIGAAASFDDPSGITTDGTNLYVADTNNKKIRKIVIATAEVTTLAGNGLDGSVDGIGTVASFKTPRYLIYDGLYLYVGDRDAYKIRRIQIN